MGLPGLVHPTYRWFQTTIPTKNCHKKKSKSTGFVGSAAVFRSSNALSGRVVVELGIETNHTLRIQVCPKKGDHPYIPVLGMGLEPSILF